MSKRYFYSVGQQASTYSPDRLPTLYNVPDWARDEFKRGWLDQQMTRERIRRLTLEHMSREAQRMVREE